MSKDKKVRVAIVGVGNCASSLVQGVHFYKDAKDNDRVPGLMPTMAAVHHKERLPRIVSGPSRPRQWGFMLSAISNPYHASIG